MRQRYSGMLIAGLALSLVTACSVAKDTNSNSAKDSGGNNNATKSGGEDSPSSAPDGAGDPANNGGGEIGVDQPDPSKAIFSKQFTHPGKTQRKVTVGILSLERKDQVLMLKVAVTPEFGDKSAGETITFVEALGPDSSWRPSLLDLKNLKKYDILRSGGGALRYEEGKAVSGQPIYGWVAFAPPPAGVKNVDLTMTEWMPRFTNVPIR